MRGLRTHEWGEDHGKDGQGGAGVRLCECLLAVVAWEAVHCLKRMA